MKRILHVMIVLSFAILLAGCDMFSQEDIINASEEYCRENPDSEVCQGDIVADLTETTVHEFFDIVISDYLSGVDVCTSYFSVTNTDLLDECRDTLNFIVPEGYTEFVLDSFTEQPTLGGSTKYVLLATTNDETVNVKFTISFVEVDGDYFVDAWGYVIEEVPIASTELTPEEAEEFFAQFIADYLDVTVTSQSLCETYDLGETVTDCALDRDEALLEGFSIELLDFSVIEDGMYQYSIEFYQDGETDVEVGDVEIFRNEDGTISIIFEDDSNYCEGRLNPVDAVPVLEQFIADYINPAISDDYINEIYFDWNANMNWLSERQINLEEGIDVVLISVGYLDTTNDILKVELEITINGETETVINEMTIDDFCDGTYFIWINFAEGPGEYMLSPEEARTVLEMFIADYFNPDIPSEYLNEMYFDYMMPEEFFTDRQEDIDTGLVVEIGSIVYANGDQYAPLIVEMKTTDMDGFVETDLLVTMIFNLGEGKYLIDFHEGDINEPNRVDPEEARFVLTQFIMDYFDTSLSDDYINEMYFDFMAPEDFFAQRATDQNSGDIIELGVVEYYETNPDAPLMVEFITYRPDGNSESNIVSMKIYKLNDGRFVLDFGQQDNGEWDIEFLNDVLNQMAFDFNDQSISDELFCAMYFNIDEIGGCIDHRTKIFEQGFTIYLNGIWFENGTYMVEFYYIDGVGNEFFEVNMAYFYYETDPTTGIDLFRVHFEPVHHGPSYEELFPLVEEYMNLYMDYTLGSDAACMLLDSYQYDECFNLREIDIQEGLFVVGWELYDYEGWLLLEKHYEDLYGNTFIDVYDIKGFYNEYNELVLELFEHQDYFVDYETAKNFVESMLFDLQDTNILNEDFCAVYFTPDQFELCHQFRNQYSEFNLFLDTFELDMNSFRVILQASNGIDIFYDEYFMDVFFVNENQLNIWLHTGQYPGDDLYGFFDAMFMDLLNPDISIDEVCMMYFIESFCPLYPEMIPAEPVYYEFYIWSEPDGRNGVRLEFYDTVNNNIVYDFSFFFWYEYRDNQIYIHVEDNHEWIPWDMVFPIIDQMTMELNDSTISTIDFCANWQGLFTDEAACVALKESVLNNYSVMYLILDQFGPNMFQIEYSIMDDMGVVSQSVMVEYNAFFNEYNELVLEAVNASCYSEVLTESETIALFTQFALDYENPAISDQELLDNYFQINQFHEMFDERQEDLARGVIIDSLVFGTIDNFGYVPVTITMTLDGETRSFDEMVRFVTCDGLIQMMFAPRHDNGPNIDPMLIEELIYTYTIDFTDTTILSYDFCAIYMVNNPTLIDECVMMRDEFNSNGFNISLNTLLFNEYSINAEFVIYDMDGFIIDTLRYMVFIYEEDNQVFIEFDYSDMPPTDYIQDAANAFLEDILNPMITTDEFCQYVMMPFEECSYLRDELLAAGITNIELLFMDYYQMGDQTEWIFAYHFSNDDFSVVYPIDFILREFPDHIEFEFYLIDYQK